jgi:hypothetical protein
MQILSLTSHLTDRSQLPQHGEIGSVDDSSCDGGISVGQDR